MSDRPLGSRKRPQPYWERLRAHYYLARLVKRQDRWSALMNAFKAADIRNYGRATSPASEVLVRIAEDGSVWELTDAEKKYVDTEFSPFNGAQPYIKSDYNQRNAFGGNQWLHRPEKGAGRHSRKSSAPWRPEPFPPCWRPDPNTWDANTTNPQSTDDAALCSPS